MLDWLSDDSFRIGDVTFRLAVVDRFKSSRDCFLLVKHPEMVRRYDSFIASLRPKRIVELGIYQGGSVAFLSLVAQPERMVAIDIKTAPRKVLEDFIDERGLRERVHTRYSVDQADTAALRELVAEEFGGAPLDLVIDDASHRLAATRASFNVLFPLLRPGGVFVIEDWSGPHHLDAEYAVRAKTNAKLRARLEELAFTDVGEPPLTVLLFELLLASAYAPSLVAEVLVTDNLAHVVRGPAEIDHSDFDVSELYSDAARLLIARTG
jgi:predicted O-methyltransferase YrrM